MPTAKSNCVHTSARPLLALPASVGYQHRNFEHLDVKPGVIFDPSASTADLLGWCWAEVHALDEIVSMAADGIEPPVWTGIVTNKLEPILKILDYLTTREARAR